MINPIESREGEKRRKGEKRSKEKAE